MGKPLGFDAGTYLYVGSGLLDGRTPYEDVALGKGPVTALVFGLIRLVSGTSPGMVRLTLLLAAALTALALAAYVARYAGRGAGLLAGLTFALLSSTPFVMGDEPVTEHYGLALMVGCLWLASRGGLRSSILAGAMATAAVLMNVGFAVIAPFALIELFRAEGPPGLRGRLFAAAGGSLLVAAPIFAWLAMSGALDDMWLLVWGEATVAVAGDPIRALGRNPTVFTDAGLLEFPVAPLFAGGLVGGFVALTDRRLRPVALTALLWIVVMWARVKISNYEFPHQYYPAMAGIAAGIALGTAAVWGDEVKRRIAVAALVLAIPVETHVIEPQRFEHVYPDWSPGSMYTLARPVARFVHEHTAPTDTVDLNGPNTVLWLAKRFAPTRFYDPVYVAYKKPDWPMERRRDLVTHPPAAVVVMPGHQPEPIIRRLLGRLRYRLAYEAYGARVWLRPDRT
jgi:hypothetical protein